MKALALPQAVQAESGAAVAYLRSEAAAAVHAYALIILLLAVVGLMCIIVGGLYLAWCLVKNGVDAILLAGSTLRSAPKLAVTAVEEVNVVKFYQSPAGAKLHMSMECPSLKHTNPKMIKEHAVCLICSRRCIEKVEKAHMS